MSRLLREPINSLSHLMGALLSAFGASFLIERAVQSDQPVAIAAAIIFSAGLISLYMTSAWYHGTFRRVRFLRKLDHTMIYVLIAATYTPICLITLKGWMGTALLATIWSLALAGAILKFLWLDAPRWLYTSFYLILGWAALIVIYPLAQRLPIIALLLLFSGGIFYSVGAVIYARKPTRFHLGAFGFHEIFHLFILLGSFSHFLMIYRYVM